MHKERNFHGHPYTPCVRYRWLCTIRPTASPLKDHILAACEALHVNQLVRYTSATVMYLSTPTLSVLVAITLSSVPVTILQPRCSHPFTTTCPVGE